MKTNGSILKADSKIIVGININKIPWGLIYSSKLSEWPNMPSYGIYAPNIIPDINNNGE